MKFAITASDRYLGVFNTFLAAGWEPLRLFTGPTDDPMFSANACIERAAGLKVGIQLSRMGERDLANLRDDGCEVLVVASYQWRIGDWRPFMPYAVNFHPSPLPDFRGPYPLINGLLAQRRRWGIVCHKVEPAFDSGDILARRDFDVAPLETHDTLDLKTQMHGIDLAREVAAHLPALWSAAAPQGPGSYAPLCGDTERTLAWTDTVETLLRTVRAFGRFECLAVVNGIGVRVARADGWVERHTLTPGTVAHAHALATVVACQDGYIAIMEWHLFGRAFVTGTPLR